MGPREEPRYTFSFLSKVLANEPSPGSPSGSLWREIPVYRAFCISLKNLIKIPLNKMALRKKCLSMFPKSRAPMEADARFRALLNISLGVPSKGALISCLINKLSLRIHRKQISLVDKTIKVLAPALCWICLSWHKCFVLKTWSSNSKFLPTFRLFFVWSGTSVLQDSDLYKFHFKVFL